MRKLIFLPALLFSFCLSSTAQSLRFNGSSSYVSIGNYAALHLKSFTLEAWVNIQGSGGTTGTAQGNEGGFKASTVVPIIAKGHREKGSAATAINYFFGYRSSDRKLVADFEDNATGAHHTVIGNTSLATSKWVHIAVTYAAGTWKLFINGVVDKTSTFTSGITPQSASNVSAAIASSLNSNGSAEGFFNGMIDEVRIWNIARTSTDISGNYQSELTTGTGLVARYGFNEGTGSTASNSVASTSTGELINSPQWTTGFNQNGVTNQAPVLGAIGNKTVTAGQALTFTATATDADAGQALTFSLIGAPSGATINATTGAFSWTPATAGSYTFTVRVSDNGSPVLTDDEQITVTVNDPITSGILSPVADAYTRSGIYANDNYGSTTGLTVKGTTSVDFNRATYLRFSLNDVSAVGSAVLRLYGNNTESTATITLLAYGVNDDSWQESTITWNNAPKSITSSLASVGVSSQPMYYEFDVTGFVQSQLNGDKIASLLIKDPTNQNKASVFSSRENAANPPELKISATPLNHAPVLAAIGNKTVTLGNALTFTASATDEDANQTLSYTLIGAPSGATINAATGAFSWTPPTSGSYPFTVRVSDNGSPVLTDEEPITVTVNAPTVNHAPNAPASPSPSNGAVSSTSGTSLCITASDADNDPLRVRFYGRKKVSGSKFTMVLIPDPQYYVAEPQGTHTAYNTMFKSQTQWIANNRVARNIQFVGGLGDCVEHGDTFDVEWRRVDTVLKTIENASLTGLIEGIPYGLCVGNHDQSPRGDPKGTTTLYNKYFGTARLGGRTYYGGHNGTNNDNHYELFSASGIDFLVLCPEYDQSTGFSAAGGTLDWMESIVKQYPNRKIIVITHFVIDLSSNFTPQGSAIYNRLKVYPNFILMVGGHIASTTGAGEAQRTDTYNGNVVNTITQDYQNRTNGGNGLMRTYEFNPQTNSIYIQTYSPYTNTYETDANSQFTINTNLSVTPDAYTLIGEVSNVASGSSACVNWPSLLDNTTYEWYAEVWDGTTTTTGPVWSFSTQSVAATSMINSNQAFSVIGEGTTSNTGLVIYPNPNRTRYFTLSLPGKMNGVIQLEITDMTGKVQLRKQFEEVTGKFRVEHHLSPGTYMVLLKSNSSHIAEKLIVTE